jgi:hypothetical protein
MNVRGIRYEDWNYPASKTDALTYIKHQIQKDPQDIIQITTNPCFEDEAWKIAQIRQCCIELNDLFCALEAECSSGSCPEMKAGEWLYLCAAHPETNNCPAIDYILHTLESAAIILVTADEKTLANLVRRLYRIFAHCYFHHKDIFLEFEETHCLYKRFLDLTFYKYQMITDKMIIIPSQS